MNTRFKQLDLGLKLLKLFFIAANIIIYTTIFSPSVGLLQGNSQQAAPSAPQIRGIPALEYWADTLGNQNGYVQDLEDDYLQMKLAKGGKEFFIIMMRPSAGFDADQTGMARLYLSKQELAKRFESNDIKGEVGIICFDREGKITGAWSAWASISEVDKWKEAKTPVLNFKALLEQRRVS